MTPQRFLEAVSGVAVAAAVGAALIPMAVPATSAFRWAVVASALVALVSAGYNAYSAFAYGGPRFAAAFVAAVLGLWLVAAPLTYGAGTLGTDGTHLAGMVLAATAGYATLDGVERVFRGVPTAVEPSDERDFGSTTADGG